MLVYQRVHICGDHSQLFRHNPWVRGYTFWEIQFLFQRPQGGKRKHKKTSQDTSTGPSRSWNRISKEHPWYAHGLASGKRLHITMEHHHFSWVNSLFHLFLWPFSIAFCMFTGPDIPASSSIFHGDFPKASGPPAAKLAFCLGKKRRAICCPNGAGWWFHFFNGNFRILKWRYLPYIRPI